MTDAVLSVLEEGRRREKAQALFYRKLAAEAGASGDPALTDRFNDLHADEQHHLSRLTARIFELDRAPAEIPTPDVVIPGLDGWEEEAKTREREEVEWYRGVLTGSLDEETRGILREILESEEHHARDLAGKWMSA